MGATTRTSDPRSTATCTATRGRSPGWPASRAARSWRASTTPGPRPSSGSSRTGSGTPRRSSSSPVSRRPESWPTCGSRSGSCPGTSASPIRDTRPPGRSSWTPKGFHAPYGPTTAEQRHPGFQLSHEGDDCQWNGPSWPFSTTATLKAAANLLNDYDQDVLSKVDYFDALRIYVGSHRLELEDGRVIPWIDENLDPYTGEWLARQIKIEKGTFDRRGDHYNHSGFADLVITGLVGLRPRPDDVVEVNPLLPRRHMGLVRPRRRALRRAGAHDPLGPDRRALRQGEGPSGLRRRAGDRGLGDAHPCDGIILDPPIIQ